MNAQKFQDWLIGAVAALKFGELDDPAIDVCIDGLERIEAMIRRPPRVAVAGLSRSGKTSVAMLLSGASLLSTSVVRTAKLPVTYRYGLPVRISAVTECGSYVVEEDRLPDHLHVLALEANLGAEPLKDFEIVETPFSEELAGVIRTADITIWCTRARRAWTGNERELWAGLPDRHRRFGLLVATRTSEDDLLAPAALTLEDELRQSSAGQFRDVLEVSLESPDPGPESFHMPGDPLAEGGARNLRARVAEFVTAVRNRRAVKAVRIARRLARLTFHNMASQELRPAAAQQLDDWVLRSSSLMERYDTGVTGMFDTLKSLILEFSSFTKGLQTAAEAGVRHPKPSAGAARPQRRLTQSRRMLEFMVADLTALLRLELAARDPVRPEKTHQYRQARAILLGLADIDAEFQALDHLVRENERERQSESRGAA